MRCIACNRQLNEVEILGSKPDGTPEDMCVKCRAKSKDLYTYTRDHEYLFEVETDPYKAHLYQSRNSLKGLE